MEAETTPAAATNGVATNGGVRTMSVTATAAPEVVTAASAGWQQEAVNNAVERANDEEEAVAAAAADADAGNIVYMDEVRSKSGRIWDNSHK